jgi:predicted HTH domain antitoxin
MSLFVEFPEELLVVCREEPEMFKRKVMILALGKLYQEGKISSGIASDILGCNRLEFYRLISEQGFAVIDYTETEFEQEVRTSRELAKKLTNL